MTLISENGLDMHVIVWSLERRLVGRTLGLAKAAENQRQRFLHRNLTSPSERMIKFQTAKVTVPWVLTSANKTGSHAWVSVVELISEDPSVSLLEGKQVRRRPPAALSIQKVMLNQTETIRQNPCTITLHVTFYQSHQRKKKKKFVKQYQACGLDEWNYTASAPFFWPVEAPLLWELESTLFFFLDPHPPSGTTSSPAHRTCFWLVPLEELHSFRKWICLFLSFLICSEKWWRRM